MLEASFTSFANVDNDRSHGFVLVDTEKGAERRSEPARTTRFVLYARSPRLVQRNQRTVAAGMKLVGSDLRSPIVFFGPDVNPIVV